MPEELPPNKACPKCGVGNLATASRCLECGASLSGWFAGPEPVYRITGKEGGAPRPRRGLWRGFCRVMSVPGIALGLAAIWPDQESRGVAAVVGLLGGTCLAITSMATTSSADIPRARPHYAWYFIDGLLRGVGCLFSIMAALVISFGGLLLVTCFCNAR